MLRKKLARIDESVNNCWLLLQTAELSKGLRNCLPIFVDAGAVTPSDMS